MILPATKKLLVSIFLVFCISGLIFPVSASPDGWDQPWSVQNAIYVVNTCLTLELNGRVDSSERTPQIIIFLPKSRPIFPINQPKSNISIISPPDRGIIQVQMAIPYPTFPEKMMVYRDITNVTEEYVTTVARSVGIDGEYIDCDSCAHIKGTMSDLWIENDTGFINYHLVYRPNEVNDTPTNTPTIEEAREIALEYLESTGLMEKETTVRAMTGEEGYTYGANNTKKLKYRCSRVIVSRTIDGTPVVYNSIRVDVCGNGDVIDLAKKWPLYEPYKEYPIISSKEAYEHFLQTDIINVFERVVGSMTRTRYQKYGAKAGEMPIFVNVTQIDLVYFGKDTHESGVLRPAHKFTYDFIVDDQTAQGVMLIPAVPELGKLEE
jgi:hypothetical protein